MQAIMLNGFGGPEQFSCVELPTPAPEAGEALLRLRANGVCYHDVLARQGHFPRTQLPGIIGHEMAGDTAEEVPGVIAFLCSPAAGFITGEVIHVNGGLHMH